LIIKKLAIRYLQWYLKRNKIHILEFVIRDDGFTMYKRNFEEEKSIQETLSKIK
jgi:hypothetical protein